MLLWGEMRWLMGLTTSLTGEARGVGISSMILPRVSNSSNEMDGMNPKMSNAYYGNFHKQVADNLYLKTTYITPP